MLDDLTPNTEISGTRFAATNAPNSEFLSTSLPNSNALGNEMAGTRIENTAIFSSDSSGYQDDSSEFLDAIHNDPDSFQAQLDTSVTDYQIGDIIQGTVREIAKSGIIADIGYKSDGFIPVAELSNNPDFSLNDIKIGETVDVFITKLESKEGYTMLSRKRAEYELIWQRIGTLAKSREIVNTIVTNRVEGGLVVDYAGLRGFIPASQAAGESDSDLNALIGKTLPVIVLQADRKRRKVIFSHRATRNRQNHDEILKLLESLEVGQIVPGTVSSIKPFGVFVDIGGDVGKLEGLVHISELSWARVNNPNEVVKTGDNVQVFILGINRDSGRISLGMKQLRPDPWVSVNDHYKVGQVVPGVISRIVPFGAFVKLSDDLEGLIHISELSNARVESAESVVSVGQAVNVRILKVLADEQRIGLSLRNTSESSSSESTPDSES